MATKSLITVKRILFITLSSCGGAQRMTLLYAKILRQAGYDCRLLIVQAPSEDFELKLFISADQPYDLIHDRFRHLYHHVVRYVLRVKPDCVFSSFSDMAPTLVFTKMLMPGMKIVVRESNIPTKHKKRRSYLSKLFLRYADALIAQTDEMKQEMLAFYHLASEKVTVINNPLDTSLIRERIKEKHRYSFPECTHYVAVGRVEPQKDYITMVKAFALVLERQPLSHLDIVGISRNVWYRERLDNVICQLDIGRAVTFHGLQGNPFKYMDAADVFVLSSVYEGLPNVMLEALYLGKPVAVTRSIPYIARIIHEGKNGYTAPVGSHTALAEAMIKARELDISEKFVEVNKSEEQVKRLFSGLW